MMQATSVQPQKTVRIIPATIDTKAAITQSYRQLRVAAYCRVSSTVSISGSSSKEFYLDFLIQFLSTFRPEGFYSLFCGPVFEPLTWSFQATAPHGRLACAAFSSSRGTSLPARYSLPSIYCKLSFSPPPCQHKKRPCSREHGQRWKDLPSGLPHGGEYPCFHRYSVEGHVDSSAQIPCHTEPGATSPG